MGIRQAKQALDLLRKVPQRPSNYMIAKSYIDTIFLNFNWEIMKLHEREIYLTMLDIAFDLFELVKNNNAERKLMKKVNKQELKDGK